MADAAASAGGFQQQDITGGPGGQRRYETFVMTGDMILETTSPASVRKRLLRENSGGHVINGSGRLDSSDDESERGGEGDLKVDPEDGLASAVRTNGVHNGSSHAQVSPQGSLGSTASDEQVANPIEEIESYLSTPRGVDKPSATRLAKRLYDLDGFRRSDICRHLSKKNDYSQLTAEEYFRHFDFAELPLAGALRVVLAQCALTGETQERERVLIHFSRRYVACNPEILPSEDACHTLTCALMLLNTDLHGANVGKRMTSHEFIVNLADLNDGADYPKELLKHLYSSIKEKPLEWAVDDVDVGMGGEAGDRVESPTKPEADDNARFIAANPFLQVPDPSRTTEYISSYIKRKCVCDPNGKRTPRGRRQWKTFYGTVRDLILYLHKDNTAFAKPDVPLDNAIRIHHALATRATDYTKRAHVIRLRTADWSEFFMQTGNQEEQQSWMDAVNTAAATLSAPPLPGAVGSQIRFQRPLLPSSYTKLNMEEQLTSHEQQWRSFQQQLDDYRAAPPPPKAKAKALAEYSLRLAYLDIEVTRYRAYTLLLSERLSRLQQDTMTASLVETSIGEVDESGVPEDEDAEDGGGGEVTRQLADRYSYRAAIYRQQGGGEGGVTDVW